MTATETIRNSVEFTHYMRSRDRFRELVRSHFPQNCRVKITDSVDHKSIGRGGVIAGLNHDPFIARVLLDSGDMAEIPVTCLERV